MIGHLIDDLPLPTVDGHDDSGQLHDQLHSLLHHVQAVQTHVQVVTSINVYIKLSTEKYIFEYLVGTFMMDACKVHHI